MKDKEKVLQQIRKLIETNTIVLHCKLDNDLGMLMANNDPVGAFYQAGQSLDEIAEMVATMRRWVIEIGRSDAWKKSEREVLDANVCSEVKE